MKLTRKIAAIALMLVIAVGAVPLSVFAQQDELPDKYDPTLSGRVTAVRQSPQAFDLCWAYSTTASLEQSLIFSGLDNASVDLSESALAWFSSQSEKKLLEDEQRYANNYIMAPVYAAARLCGIEYEADEPTYLHFPHLNPVSYSQQGICEYEIEMAENCCGERDEIKKKLMEYGGATVCCYNDRDFFSKDHKSYYQKDRKTVNHSVTVIGWDDDYSRDNFGRDKPEKDGAWLVKSVWGTRNDNGYYWVSYYEPELTSFIFYKMRKASNDSVYTYNGGMDRLYVSSKGAVSAANVFEAQNNETLEEVSFFIEENGGKGTDYTVNVYKDLKDGTPVSDTVCANISGRAQYDGYYTVKMPSEIKLGKGDRFSVAVTLSSDNGKNYFVAEDAGCKCEKGQTYYYSNDEQKWQDSTETSFKNAYINAYTKRSGKPDTSLLKQLVEKYDNKDGMQRAVLFAKSVLNNSDAGYIEVCKAEKLINAASNECSGYTVIKTADQWNAFAKDVNSGTQYRDKTVVVEDDIDFTGTEFISAGFDKDSCFNGCFLGNGHVFKGVSLSAKDDVPVGLFGYVGNFGQVRDIVLSGCEISADTAGGIAGICKGGTITGCGFYGSIKGKTCGGIVGWLENGTVSDCWSDVSEVSGVIGKCSDDGKYCVQNCFSTALDDNSGVRKAESADKLEQLLNSNGGRNVAVRRFGVVGGVLRTLRTVDSSPEKNEKTNVIESHFSVILTASIIAAVFVSGLVITFIVLRKKKR